MNANRKYDPVEASYRGLFSHHRATAKARKIEFILNEEQHKNIVTQNCHYCGIEPSRKYNVYSASDGGRKRPLQPCRILATSEAWIEYTGIDRIDSDKGYEIDNVVPCCTTCNYAKRDMTSDEFDALVLRICKFRFGVFCENNSMV